MTRHKHKKSINTGVKNIKPITNSHLQLQNNSQTWALIKQTINTYTKSIYITTTNGQRL